LNSIFAGSGCTCSSSASEYSAHDPLTVRPVYTRSFGFTFLTPSPTASTTPAPSDPGVYGIGGFTAVFAAWTVVLLSGTVGYFRWSRILTGRATIREWRPDEDQGTDWYRRAMRVHANCLENLPLYTAVVLALLVAKASSPWLDVLAVILLVSRIAQSTLHIGPKQTELVAGARFGCYAIQVVCMIIMGVWAAVVVS
jgi:uncharacterized MAPEG superfamily protein